PSLPASGSRPGRRNPLPSTHPARRRAMRALPRRPDCPTFGIAPSHLPPSPRRPARGSAIELPSSNHGGVTALAAEVAGIEPTGRGAPVPLVLKTRGATRPRSPPGPVYHAVSVGPSSAGPSSGEPDSASARGSFGDAHAASASVTARYSNASP